MVIVGSCSGSAIGSTPQHRNRPASEKKRSAPAWVTRAWSEAQTLSMSRMKSQYQSELLNSFGEVMDNAGVVAVYALGGSPRKPGAFHGYFVQGRSQVLSPAEISNLGTIVRDSITAPQGPALCFVPHHGLRFVQGNRRVDVLLCYTCKQMYVQMGKRYAWFNINQSTLPALNRVFQKARIPTYELPPEPTTGK